MSFLREGQVNGKPKVSFGRASSFTVIMFAILLIGAAIFKEYQSPTTPIDFKVFEPSIQQVITVTEFVPSVDWKGYAEFLLWGIVPLLAVLYPASKATTALQTAAESMKKQ